MKPDPPQLSPNASEKPIKAHAIDVVAMDIRHYEHKKEYQNNLLIGTSKRAEMFYYLHHYGQH
jgi:hypothetical protein